MNAQVQSATSSPASATEPIAVEDTRPYPWPYDNRLAATDFAFVVVTGSAAGASGQAPAELLSDCRSFAEATRAFGGRVIWVACNGSELPDDIDPTDMTAVSPTGNGMIGGELELILRSQRIDRFALAGWPLETVVHSTMRRANDIGYECLLLEDLALPIEVDLQESAVSQILMSGGIFGAVGTSQALANAFEKAKGDDS